MRDLPGNLLKLVAVLVVGYVVARVGFHYYVKNQLKEATNEVAAYAIVKYETLETDIDGSVNISKVTVTPLGQDQSINIQSVYLTGPTLLQIIHDYLPLLGNAGLPSYGRIRFEDVSLPLRGSLSDQLDATMQEANGGRLDVCGVQGLVSVAMARNLGRSMLHGDANASYRYDAKSKMINGDFFFGVRDMQSVGLTFEFANVSPEMLSGQQPQMPSISSMTLKFAIDPDYGYDVSDYCAAKNGVSIEDYQLLLADQFVRQQRGYGIELGWGLQSTVKQFYKDWGEVELLINPASPLNPMGLLMLGPEKLLDSLGLELTLNGQLITDLDLKISEAKGRVSALLIPPKKVFKAKKRRAVYQSVYRQVPVSSLSRYVNQSVIMYTRNGAKRTGVLVTLDADTARLDQRQPGGQFSSYVPIHEIERVDVLFKELVPQKSTTPKAKTEQAKANSRDQSTNEQGQADAAQSADEGAADQQ